MACCAYTGVSAQTWSVVGGGVSLQARSLYFDSANQVLYVGGKFAYVYTATDTLEANGIAAWDGVQWSVFPPGDTSCSANCAFAPTSIELLGDSLVIGGIFNTFGGIPDTRYAACWDGSNWSAFGSPDNPTDVRILNSELYAIGIHDTIGGIYSPSIAKWNGTSWEAFTTSNYFDEGIRLIEEYNGELIVAGSFVHNSVEDIAKWNGVDWESMGNPVVGGIAYINDIIEYNGLLFVGGYFSKSNGSTGDWLTYWDGVEWHDFPSTLVQFTGPTMDFEIINGELYIACVGGVAGDPNTYGMAKYNGSELCFFGGVDNFPLEVVGDANKVFVRGGYIYDGDTSKWLFEMAAPIIPDTCVSIPLAIQDHNLNKPNIRIYPNPAADLLNVELEGYEESCNYTLYSSSGQTIRSGSFSGSHTQIPLTGVSNGYYLLSIESETFTAFRKVLISR